MVKNANFCFKKEKSEGVKKIVNSKNNKILRLSRDNLA